MVFIFQYIEGPFLAVGEIWLNGGKQRYFSNKSKVIISVD